MAEAATHGEVHRYPAPTSFIRKYIFSIDHKIIGIQYLLLALTAVIIRMIMSVLLRMNLSWPGTNWPILGKLFPQGPPGGVMPAEVYLSLVTMQGTVLVCFVLTTAPQGGFGNYFLPIQIGADDMAFAVLNMLSFWVTFVGFIVLCLAIFAEGNATVGGWFTSLGASWAGGSGTVGPIGGWTGYPPLSALGKIAGPGQGAGVNLWIISIAIFCVGSLLGALNFITTLLNMRTRGMSLMRMPLTCWAWFTTAVLALLSFPVLLGGGILLMLDRMAGTSFFIPGGLYVSGATVPLHTGGSPLLWQHLFWFFGHPEVYIAIVPGMGIVSHVLVTNMRKPMLSHRVLVYSMGALAILSYMVYGHHMFVSGMNPKSSLAFSFPTLVITIPSTIVVLIWLGSLYGAKIRINSASLFALGFISMFISGGVSGFFLAQPSVDIMLHATYFVVGHFHMVMGVAAMFGIFAGTYFWFPKMFGRMMNETLGKVHFWCTFVGTYAIFMPFHYLGLAGNIRRYQAFVVEYMQPLIPVHKFITIAALVTGAAQLIFIYNLIHSRFRGAPAPANPWQATSLEWSTPSSPPPFDNFGGKLPTVYHDPYQYGVEGSSTGDYVMQTSPEQVKGGLQMEEA